MRSLTFVLNEPVSLAESITCEFKEVKNQPPVVVIASIPQSSSGSTQ